MFDKKDKEVDNEAEKVDNPATNEEKIPEIKEEYVKPDPNACSCGGTYVLVGRSQDAHKIHSVYECDLCKTKRYESNSKS